MVNEEEVIRYRLYLIQRGTFQDPSKRESQRPFKDVINFDYMGSAEFEFGSVNRSFGRIVRAYRNDKLKHVTSEIKNLNGVPLQFIYIDQYDPEDAGNLKGFDQVNRLIHRPDKHFNIDAYIKEVRKYINGNNPKEICSYRLKERISLHERCYKFYIEKNKEDYADAVRYAHSIGDKKPYLGERDDFWLDISNDVMMFFSVQDRVDIIFNELKKYKEEEKE